MKRFWPLLLLTVACNGTDGARVHIDLGDLLLRSPQGAARAAELVITGIGVDMAPVSLDGDNPTFEVDVPSGRDRTFAVEVTEERATEWVTILWGFTIVDLAPDTEIQLTIPVAPAGRVPGSIELSDGATVPASVEVIFDYFVNPIAQLPGPLATAAANGAFSLPLPAGEYEITVGSVNVAGTNYALVQSGFVLVAAGEIADPVLLVLDPICSVGGAIECCQTSDCSASEVCNTTTHQCDVSQVLVEVIDPAGQPYTVAPVQVLVHDSEGTYLRQAATDPFDGQVLVDAPAGSMVSVLYTWNSGYDEATVLTVAEVAPGDSIRYQLPGYLTPTQLGTVTVSADLTAPPTITSQWVTVPGDWYYPAVRGSPAVGNIYSTGVGSDGNVDLLAWGVDGATSAITGFSPILDLPTTGGSVTLDTWDESPLAWQVSFFNDPGSFWSEPRPVRQGVDYYLNQFISGPTPTADVILPAGFFNFVDLETRVDSWPQERSLRHRRINDQLAPLSIDFAADLLPVIDGDPNQPQVDLLTVPARPTVDWSTTAVSTQFDATRVYVRLEAGTVLVWQLLAPSNTAAPVRMPDLSNAPLAYRPEIYATPMERVEVELFDVDVLSTYREFVNDVGHRKPDWRAWPQQDLVVRVSSYLQD